MYVDICKYKRGDKSYTRTLLRESYRENGKVKQRTIANVSHLSEKQILTLKAALKGKVVPVDEVIDVRTAKMKQGKSVGALFTLIAIANKVGITAVLKSSRAALLVLWLVFARIINQGSRLSAVRLADRHAVAELMGLSTFNKNHLYNALDWAADNQAQIEKELFHKRFPDKIPTLFLYDVTSSYLEGTQNELGNFGYNRDKKRGKMQIVIGLLTDPNGVPVAVRVFEGNTTDPTTCLDQIKLLANKFEVKEVTLVGDRGMIKSAQIEKLSEQHFHYITAITKPQIRTLINDGIIQLDLFDEQITEVSDNGVRYILRRNPIRADDMAIIRQSKYDQLTIKVDISNHYLEEHERAIVDIQLRNLRAFAKKLNIASWVSFAVDGRTITISKDDISLQTASQLDGCYVIKTDLTVEQCDARTVHDRYKELSQVESAFRTMKTELLEVRPIYVYKDKRTRGHIFITMLAYMITQEIKRLTPLDKNIPIKEQINDLSSIQMAELEDNDGTFYRVPTPNRSTQSLLNALKVSIPLLILKSGLQLL